MAEPNNKKRPIVRHRTAPTVRYTASPDAVNETLRVIGLAPEQTTQKQAAARNEVQLSEQHKANQENRARPQLSQGYSKSERQARRKAGLLYTQEDIEHAKNLAEAHNASFFGSMVAPPISEEMAERNPGYVQEVIRGDAAVLPNAFVSGLSFGTPSATAAVVKGVGQGWQAAGNVGTKVLNATTQGAKAVVPVVTNPRWAASTAALTVPAAADAYDGGGSSDFYAPVILSLATLGTGYGAYKGYGTLKRSGWNLKALKPGAEGRAVRAAANAPQTASTAVVPYKGVYESPGLFGSWWETPKKSAAAAGFPVPSKGQIWGARGRNYLRLTGYGMGAGTLLDLGMSGASGEPFQWKAGRLPIALPEYIVKGGYNALKGWYYPNAGQSPTQATDSVTTQSQQVANPTDSIVIVPASSEASPYTDDLNIDSLNAVAAGIPYTRQ